MGPAGADAWRRLTLLGIALSFALKFPIGYHLGGGFFGRGNSFTMLNALAMGLVERGEFSIHPGLPSISYEPLYPWLLALGYGAFGYSWLGPTLIQAALSALTSWMLFLICRRLGDERAGLIAASYHGFYPVLFMYSLSVVDVTLFVCVSTASVWAAMGARGGAPWRLALLGALMGLMFLSRGSALAFVPAVAVYALWDGRPAEVLKRAAIMLVAAYMVTTPWLLRNHSLTGEAILSVHGTGGFGLWQGNHERSYALIATDESLDRVYRDEPAPEIYARMPLSARRTAPEDVRWAKAYKAEARAFILAHKGEFARLALLKLRKFWSPIYNPTAREYGYGGALMRQAAYMASYLPLLILLPFGLARLWGLDRALALAMIGIGVTYTGAHMAVMGFTRARLPLDTLLMTCAALALSCYWGLWRARRAP